MTTAEDFERERPHLTGLAYRMLGSRAEAEDVVQQTFLRWWSAGRPHLESPRAWFTRACSRLCLDRLKSAQRRREQYVGTWLPEPWSEPSPHDTIDDSLSMALLLTIERLRPAERAAFLLHDVFGYSFAEIAEILDLEAANCRQLAARARRHLRRPSRRGLAGREEVERLSEAFFAAVESGDLDGLRTLLADDVVLRADGGGKASAVRKPLEGADSVARFFHRILGQPTEYAALRRRDLWLNGAPGVVLYEGEEPVSAFHFSVESGEIRAIFVQRNPDKLRFLRKEEPAP